MKHTVALYGNGDWMPTEIVGKTFCFEPEKGSSTGVQILGLNVSNCNPLKVNGVESIFVGWENFRHAVEHGVLRGKPFIVTKVYKDKAQGYNVLVEFSDVIGTGSCTFVKTQPTTFLGF